MPLGKSLPVHRLRRDCEGRPGRGRPGQILTIVIPGNGIPVHVSPGSCSGCRTRTSRRVCISGWCSPPADRRKSSSLLPLWLDNPYVDPMTRSRSNPRAARGRPGGQAGLLLRSISGIAAPPMRVPPSQPTTSAAPRSSARSAAVASLEARERGPELLQAREAVSAREEVDVGESRLHAAGERLVGGILLQRVEPDDAVGEA